VQDTFNCDRLVAIKVLHLNYSDLGHQEADFLRRLKVSDVVGFAPLLRLYVCTILCMILYDMLINVSANRSISVITTAQSATQ